MSLPYLPLHIHLPFFFQRRVLCETPYTHHTYRVQFFYHKLAMVLGTIDLPSQFSHISLHAFLQSRDLNLELPIYTHPPSVQCSVQFFYHKVAKLLGTMSLPYLPLHIHLPFFFQRRVLCETPYTHHTYRVQFFYHKLAMVLGTIDLPSQFSHISLHACLQSRVLELPFSPKCIFDFCSDQY